MQLAGLLLGVIGSRADVTAWSLAYVAFVVVGAVGFSVLAISFTRRHPPSRWVVVLGAKGLVAAKRGTGTTTLEASEWNLLDADVVRWRLRSPDRFHQLKEMLELRSAFEPEASALAAAHATPDQITALLSCAAKLWGLGHRDDPDAFIEADVEFHRLLLTASGNRIFAQLAPMIASILRGRLEEGLTPEHPDGRALDQHLALAGAIGGRDPEEARRLTRELVEATSEESRSLWEPAAACA